MASKYTKAAYEKIKAQDEEINYLKSKLYELAKTNKHLEKELDYANRKIQNLESSSKNTRNNSEKHETKTYEKWHKVENKRSRKNQVKKSRNYKENWVSKHRNHTSNSPNTPTINTHQRTNYSTKKNETNKNEKPSPPRHAYTQRNAYGEPRKYKQLRTKNDH